MNKIHRIVWSEATGTWTAVSELAKGRSKSTCSSGAASLHGLVRKPLAHALALAGLTVLTVLTGFTGLAHAQVASNQLPTGANVVAGQAGVTQAGAVMNINQSSARAVIDWQTFNLGSQARINFNQPSAASATLNRVLDTNPSQIFGRISAPGQVLLVNPNGVYFGAGASVDVGSLVATTHGITNADFLAGNLRFSRNGATGSVVNEGELSAGLGGYIALLAPEVRNQGVVVAQMGTVALAAGEAFDLSFDGSGTLANVRVEASTIRSYVENGHAVQAPGGLIILSAQAADSLQGAVINNAGTVSATSLSQRDGLIRLESSHALVNTGQLQATDIAASVTHLVDAGTWDASAAGTGAERGGRIDIAARGHVEQAVTGVYNASGTSLSAGGTIRVVAGTDAWLSGTAKADGQAGGEIAVTAPSLTVAGATLSATGAQAGGRIRVGGGWQGRDTDLANAVTTTVMSSDLDVSATQHGDAGTAVVWSDDLTRFAGRVVANGGSQGGDGGQVEVSSHGQLDYAGSVSTSALNGNHGALLLDPQNIQIVAAASVLNILNLPVTSSSSIQFGSGGVLELSGNGNIVVNSPSDSTTGVFAGAVRLYNGQTGALISSLTGSQNNDRVGRGGVKALGNGNFVVNSYSWKNVSFGSAGAVTWVNGTTGRSGPVSSSNSLVGGKADDQIGGAGITVLPSGNYLVSSPQWDNASISNVGAVTWGSGTTGVAGLVTASNSLIGGTTGDSVGFPLNAGPAVVVLANGNYVVVSPNWSNGTFSNAGAVTWGSGTTGARGAISSTNSLIGSRADDYVGEAGASALPNGNYVVASPNWSLSSTVPQVGAVTLGNGTTGTVGAVTTSNSLTGSASLDRVGLGMMLPNQPRRNAITVLSDGNFAVNSSIWSGGRGAVTRVVAANGTSGTVSASNSLVGTLDDLTTGASYDNGDRIGGGGVTALSNGGYVVASPYWDNGGAVNAGAVTWAGSSGQVGPVSTSNSLHGTGNYELVGSGGVVALTQGNFVVSSPNWGFGPPMGSAPGAVTWGSGTSGVVGAISASNSLVGSVWGPTGAANGITALANGHYVVVSPYWADDLNTANLGAITWGNGTTGISGAISSYNSLVGVEPNSNIGSGGVTLLPGNKYVVASPSWARYASTPRVGAVTWLDGAVATSGMVSVSNSLVGSSTDDRVGETGVVVLSNGNYVVASRNWDLSSSITNAGAVTLASGASGRSGEVSANNSLVGSSTNDFVGAMSGGNLLGVTALTNGDYAVASSQWDNGGDANVGAVTLANGSTGINGTINSANSMLGSSANDALGNGSGTAVSGVLALSGGRALVISPAAKVNGFATGRVDILSASAAPGPASLVAFSAQPGSTSLFTASAVEAMLSAGTSVTLQASNDISIDASITANNTAGSGGALTLQAGRSLLINQSITTDNGALTLVANDLVANGVNSSERNAGAATIAMASGTTLDTGTGALSLSLRDGDGLTNRTSGSISLQTLSAGAVNIVNSGITAGSSVDLLGNLQASGPVLIASDQGDVNIAGNLVTTDSSAEALVVNAGRASLAGTSTGGDIDLAGSPTVSVGTGGQSTFYTGSLGGSAGLASLVGAGNSRYSSDEATSHFTDALVGSRNAIYRESPVVTVQANAYSTMYGEVVAPSAYSVAGAFANGDVSYGTVPALASNAISSAGTSVSNVGAYDLSMQLSGYSSLGYAITPIVNVAGHSITRRLVTVAADNQTKAQGTADAAFTYQVTAGSLVNGDTLTGSMVRQVGETVGQYAIDPSGLVNANYNVTPVNGTMTITTAPSTTSAPVVVPPVVVPQLSIPTTTSAPLGLPEPQPATDATVATSNTATAADSSATSPESGPAASEKEASDDERKVVAAAAARSDTGAVAPTNVVTHNAGGVTVTLVNTASAQAPGVVTVALPIELVAPGAGFAFPLPAPVIAQAASTAAVQVRLPNGAPLPSWLAFDPQTRVVTAVAIPQGAMPLQVVVTSGGASTSVLISARP